MSKNGTRTQSGFRELADRRADLIAVAHGKKTKSAQFIFLSEHQEELVSLLGLERFPVRSTYCDRYRGAHCFVAEMVRLHGVLAVRYGWAEADIVAADRSVIAARGRFRHKSQRKKQSLRGVDHEAAWGRKEHDG